MRFLFIVCANFTSYEIIIHFGHFPARVQMELSAILARCAKCLCLLRRIVIRPVYFWPKCVHVAFLAQLPACYIPHMTVSTRSMELCAAFLLVCSLFRFGALFRSRSCVCVNLHNENCSFPRFFRRCARYLRFGLVNALFPADAWN